MVIAECFHFHRRAQNLGESVTDYVEITWKSLRNRLVCGIRDVHTQNKLLTVDKLTLARAAQGEEATERKVTKRKGKCSEFCH